MSYKEKTPGFLGRILNYFFSIIAGFLAGLFVCSIWFFGHEILAIIIGAIAVLWISIETSLEKSGDFKSHDMRRYHEYIAKGFIFLFFGFLAAILSFSILV